MIAIWRMAFLAVLIAGSLPAFAEEAPAAKLQTCLKQADDAPDDAAAAAQLWAKQGGGDRANLCMAYAQFNRGEYADAAQGFATLAGAYIKNNPKHAAQLFAQAGRAYARANANKKAETQYTAALKLEPQDPDVWMDRAQERAATEHYWDAVDDINKSLEIMPDQADAYRLRGQVWTRLGLDSRAREDFVHAEDAEAEDEGLDAMPPPVAPAQKK